MKIPFMKNLMAFFSKISSKLWLFYFLIFTTLPLFMSLGRNRIEQWDESRNAMNALEMYTNGNWLVTYFEGNPDFWNTKPPFLIWLQVISMKLFGISELSIRLPSAFAGLLTCIVLYIFCKSYLKNEWIGILASLVLVTSNGYVAVHGSRTGDYDTLLTLFTTISALSLFSFIETKKNQFLYLFFISISFAVLTKGVAGLLFLPAFGIYILYRKQLVILLKNEHFYIGVFSFISIVGGYYLIRESINEGYLKAVYENELGGRSMNSIEGHTKGWFFYFENFFLKPQEHWYNRFIYWKYIFPIGLIIGLIQPSRKISKITFYSFLLVLTHFLIISSVETKIYWYDTPWFPFTALITSIGVISLIKYLQGFINKIWQNKEKNKITEILITGIIITSLFINPYLAMMKKVSNVKDQWWRDENLVFLYLQEGYNGQRKIDNNLMVYYPIKGAQSLFYIKQFLMQNKKIEFISEINGLEDGQLVLVGHDDDLKDKIEEQYKVEIVEDYKSDWDHFGLRKYKIISKK